MPILVKDYSWEETEKTVFISVPLKGVFTNKVDIFSTETYIKVHYPPYLFESFLFGPVHDQESAAQLGNGLVLFKLDKEEPAIWGQLQNPQASHKQWQITQRQQAVQRSQERSEENKKLKEDTKRDQSRFGVKSQMKLEEDDRNRIDNAKQTERETATVDLERWKQHQQDLIEQQEKQKEERLRKGEEEKEKQEAAIKKQGIFHEDTNGTPMRQTGTIHVSFTKRTFPTPMRESTAPEEDEWLKKQAESRRIIELQNKDLSEEERNPVWLRDKGNDFFKAGNYQAAINVFSHAIRLSATMPALYSNRGACHLKIGNYFKCMEDCSKALELLTPPVPQNAASRCKAHVRRGTAFCHLELYVEGLQDYEAALKLDPKNEQIQADADRMRHIIQTSSS